MSTDALAQPVAERLRATPGVQVVAGRGLDLFFRQNFLTPAECLTMIALIDHNRRPSSVLGSDFGGTFRTSESCDLDRWNGFVSSVDRRICKFMGFDERQGETLQGQRYAVGQQFKAHNDWFDTTADYWHGQCARGGQRTWTTMIYLDEPAGGGETWFSEAQVNVTPRTGMLLGWDNIGADGPNPATMHESLPVTAGVKTIVTKWFREGHWI